MFIEIPHVEKIIKQETVAPKKTIQKVSFKDRVKADRIFIAFLFIATIIYSIITA